MSPTSSFFRENACLFSIFFTISNAARILSFFEKEDLRDGDPTVYCIQELTLAGVAELADALG